MQQWKSNTWMTRICSLTFRCPGKVLLITVQVNSYVVPYLRPCRNYSVCISALWGELAPPNSLVVHDWLVKQMLNGNFSVDEGEISGFVIESMFWCVSDILISVQTSGNSSHHLTVFVHGWKVSLRRDCQ